WAIWRGPKAAPANRPLEPDTPLRDNPTLTCAYGKMAFNMSVAPVCLPDENPGLAGVFIVSRLWRSATAVAPTTAVTKSTAVAVPAATASAESAEEAKGSRVGPSSRAIPRRTVRNTTTAMIWPARARFAD
ncbi:hypothetical protein ACM0CD_09765, partial [Mycobacteroides abscessus subsp. abscessus]|uniref:hypothetical protein n=1 Tax=Mycobacteroides abscessus TaxID=36809 RepID=UPI0039F14AC0